MPAALEPSAELIAWVLRQATEGDNLQELLSGLCGRLIDRGLPLWRVSLGMPALDPTFRGATVNWWRDRPPELILSRHGPVGSADFERSPIAYLQARGLAEHRWRLEGETGPDVPEPIQELREQGATDYRLLLTAFSGEFTIMGVAISFATDRPGGFQDSELAFLERMIPALGLASYRFAIARMARELLSIYLGQRTGRRVLSGDVRRGEGQTMEAAILVADLRGFTALTEREDASAVVGWVDEQLEAVVDAVTDQGGEILKFLGDGVLAVFPTGKGDAVAGEACDRALSAAEDAIARTAALKAHRAADGAPTLDLDVVLHYGDVVYGNVGAARRLDFTVIGRAVNEASRMEALCDELERHLLLSSAFAERCSRETMSLGFFPLRGIVGSREIRAPSPGAAGSPHRRERLMANHRIDAGPDTVHWGYFDAALPPLLTVESGDTVTLSTVSGGPEMMPAPPLDVPAALPAIHAAHRPKLPGHICTGPVAVRGARAGQVLEVRIEAIALHYDWGYNYSAPLKGALPDDFDDTHVMHIPMDRARNTATLPWGLELPLAPFFGVMAVAPPPAWGAVSTLPPRRNGGNLDNKELVAGTTLYLPIHVDGALFSVGDGHGVQGDGEVCVTAIETGLVGTFELHVRDDMRLVWPMAETPTHVITMAFDPSLDACVTIALRLMLDLVVARTGLTRAEAYALCSLAADLRITQVVNGSKGVHVMLDKRCLCGRAA